MESDPKKSTAKLHVVMFPFFAFGHISPFVQLSNKLSSNGVKISFFSAAANVQRLKSMLRPDATLEIIPLTIPTVEGLPRGIESTAELNPSQAELLVVALDQMQPQIRDLLSQLKPHFVVFDFAQEWLPKMAYELGMDSVFYSVFTALATAFLTVPARLPEPNRYPTIEEVKFPPPNFPRTSITSVETFVARDFLYIFRSFHGIRCVYDRVLSGLKGSSIILAKTCNEMEAPYINYVKSQFGKPVLLVSPTVPDPPTDPLEEKWANWLSQFDAKSVIYCSFGSETFLNDDQIKELALGLELTGLPFFLVLNFPTDKDISAELKRALPEGFLGRVKNRGVIATGWVQQRQILAHSSVGYYLSHAGFSSLIEGIVTDSQLITLPQKGDQFLNSKLVSGDLKVGVEVNRRDDDGYFGKQDIKTAVENVVVEDKEPGKTIRDNQKKLKEFLLNEEAENKRIEDLVKELEIVAGIAGI
ncbi:anthocyanidin 3-O-glucosyltransferase-like [Dorcoceras hygrometricum]|uniref:Anthocyanidin 3-O-glucosyltransferase-like n=1 Tax=Dorcoceras hygrometricum TaxID=472368 RepID=A0A2Z7B2G9_9LAMI|nr:anthocyanidin 3-O-glucosyltransferase-like [Dorcoceras hygrometricum]